MGETKSGQNDRVPKVSTHAYRNRPANRKDYGEKTLKSKYAYSTSFFGTSGLWTVGDVFRLCISSQTRRVAELREGLVEEGRRRRQLYDERKWAAQSELRRVLAERAAVREKEGTLRLLLQVCILAFSVLLAGALLYVPSGENVDHAAAYLLDGWCGLVYHPLLVVRVARSNRVTYVQRSPNLPALCA